MTPTEKWIMLLALVYSVPSFISGVGITLLFVHWRDISRALVMAPYFRSPAPEWCDLSAVGFTPMDESPVA
jgi:hypothetical protein